MGERERETEAEAETKEDEEEEGMNVAANRSLSSSAVGFKLARAGAQTLSPSRKLLRSNMNSSNTMARGTGTTTELECSTSELVKLTEKQSEWKAKSKKQKTEIARKVLGKVEELEWCGDELNEDWSQLGMLEGLKEGSSLSRKIEANQKFAFGLVVKRYLQLLIQELSASETRGGGSGSSEEPASTTNEYDIFSVDSFLIPGVDMEIWCFNEGSLQRKFSAEHQNSASEMEGKCSLVLGAGNQNFLSLVDTLERVFMHEEVVLLKHHPLRPFLYGPYAKILEPLIEAGYVDMTLDQGVNFSQELVKSDLVGHIHITGSGKTHDSVRDKLAEVGREGVKISSELGCATPWIVCNGSWKEEEIEYQAKLLAYAKKLGAGANCLSPQVLIIDEDWGQSAQFQESLKKHLRELPTYPAYYPGAETRQKELAAFYEGGRVSEIAGQSSEGSANMDGKPVLSNLLLDCGIHGEPSFVDAALKNEAFCPVLAVVRVKGGDDLKAFLNKAVDIANRECTGSLSCSISSPSSVSEGSQALNEAISRLKYGGIGVNCSTLFNYISITSGGGWGAYPGLYSKSNCGSGLGFIGNLKSKSGYAKTVLRSPAVNKLADVTSLPPAILSDSLRILLLSSSTFQGMIRVAKMFYSGLVTFFNRLF